MIIGMGSDHGAYDMKLEIKKHIESLGHTVQDFGAHGSERSEYPVYGLAVAEAVAAGRCELGIVICGTGIGMSLAANKVRGIRCAVCSEPLSAMLSRRHNDCNMLAFGARVIGIEMARLIVEQWLGARFEGGRHAERVSMIDDIENRRD